MLKRKKPDRNNYALVESTKWQFEFRSCAAVRHDRTRQRSRKRSVGRTGAGL